MRYRLCASFDEESLDYQRFMTHLLFFAQRVMENKMLPDKEDFLYQNIKRQQPQAFDCTLRIRDFIKKDFADCFFMFLPVFMGITIAKKMGGNPMLFTGFLS